MFYEKPSIGAGTLARGPQSSLGEIWGAALNAARYIDNTNARARGLEEAYDQRIDAIKAATGQVLINPMRRGSVSAAEFGFDEDDPHLLFQRQLDALARQHPDHAETIAAHRPVIEDARERARRLENDLRDVMGRAGGGVLPTLAMFGGALAASVEDPLNVATMFVGPASPATAGIKGLIWMAAKSGAANAAVEASFQPIIASWRQEAGLDYSASTAALNIGSAFVLGAGLDAGVRAAIRGVQGARGRVPRLDEQGGVVGWQTPEQALEEAARRSQNELLKRAVAGDTAALRELAEATGAIEDPAVKGAFDELDIAEGLPVTVEGVDAGEHLSRIAQAIRHADDPFGQPPAPRAEPVPDARVMSLADDAALPTARRGSNQYARVFEVEGKPVTLREVDLKKTIADPETFQFKRGGDAFGVTGRLAGVERWDPIAAGRAVIYERADGQLVIADAHQRRGLAMRLADQETPVQAFIFREADGWTPGDVRALAAKKNLQEGSGSVIDAASIMRERPDIIDRSVPLGSEAMRQARALSRLSDEAFGMVVGGVLPENYAALVGDLVPDRSRHASLIAELAEADPANIREARFMVSELMALPVHAEEQMTLLGAWRVERSLMTQRAVVLDAALKMLRDDRRIFSLLNQEAGRISEAGNILAGDANAQRAAEAAQAATVLEALASTRGPVSDWLSDAARAVAQGFPRAKAAQAFANRVREALERDGLTGLQAAAPAEPRGIDEPGGPEAMRQVEELERELAAEIEAATKPPELLLQMPRGADRARPSLLQADGVRHIRGRVAEMAEIRREIMRIADMLPPDVQVRVVDRLVFDEIGDVQGIFNQADRIVYVALAADDPVGTARHEVIHGLRQSGLMTDDEFATVYAYAERKGLRSKYDIDARYKEFYTRQFGDRAEDLLKEEVVAEMFAEYRRGVRFDGGFIDRLFEMIERFVARVREVLTGRRILNVHDIFETIESGEMAARWWAQHDMPGGGSVGGIRLFQIKAFHGSPYNFDKFDMSKIGTGEGAQQYGHGLYFAEAEAVARKYQRSLSENVWNGDVLLEAALATGRRLGLNEAELALLQRAVKIKIEAEEIDPVSAYLPDVLPTEPPANVRVDVLHEAADALNGPGHLYEVRLHAEPDQLLDWDKPLSEQSAAVRDAVLPLMREIDRVPSSATGQDAVRSIQAALGGVGQEQITPLLRAAGIPGIRYLDGGSRAAGEGTHNFVLFDENLIEIVAIDGRPVASLRAELADAERAADLQSTVEACKL